MSKIYLTPYRKTEYLRSEENYSIGRYHFNDQSIYPSPVARVARSRKTKLWGWEYEDLDGKCEPIWIYDLPNRIEELKEKLDKKLIETGYVLLTQEKYDKLSLLI